MVVEYHREYCSVELEGGGEVVAKPRARLTLDVQEFARQICLGDRVDVHEAEPGQYVIEKIYPRETWLLRTNLLSYRNKPQCIVANADQLAVVTAPEPGISLNLVDRYFLAAIQGGLTPMLVVNKTDLDPELPEHLEILTYRRLGYQVYFTSAKRRDGLEELEASLKDKLTAFCGHSGVGKSSLLTVITGKAISVGDVNRHTGKGRQTTTTARVYHLPSGGQVVDTPGIREFGLSKIDWLDIHEYFSDIAELTQSCSFRDCLHKHEPGCAVIAAVEAGKLAPGRLQSYIRLREESDKRDWE